MCARTLLLPGAPNCWQKPVLLAAISAKGEKALGSLICSYGSSSSAWVTFFFNFFATLFTSKFLSLASRDLRALLLAGVLKICTELDNNMKLRRGMNCRAKGVQNLGESEAGSQVVQIQNFFLKDKGMNHGRKATLRPRGQVQGQKKARASLEEPTKTEHEEFY